jgi:copper chaperone CopZ
MNNIKFLFSALVLLFAVQFGFAQTGAVVSFETSAHCQSCKNKIETALIGTNGVSSAVLNLDNKVVTINYDNKLTSPQKLQKIIQDLGYTTKLVANPNASNNNKGKTDGNDDSNNNKGKTDGGDDSNNKGKTDGGDNQQNNKGKTNTPHQDCPNKINSTDNTGHNCPGKTNTDGTQNTGHNCSSNCNHSSDTNHNCDHKNN